MCVLLPIREGKLARGQQVCSARTEKGGHMRGGGVWTQAGGLKGDDGMLETRGSTRPKFEVQGKMDN